MIRYRSFLLPAALIAIGILALLGNFNLVPWESLYRLLDLWPLVLVVIGLEMIIRRTLRPPVGPALAMTVFAGAVIVALVYVAAAPPVAYNQQSTSSATPVGSLSRATLRLELSASTVTLRSADLGSSLYQAEFNYPQAMEPRVDVNGDTVTITDLSSFHGPWFFGRRGGNRSIDLTLNGSVPWTVALAGGATKEQLDLSGISLSKLTLEGGASDVVATLPHPSGSVKVQVSGGAEKLTLHRPAGVDVRVAMSGGANSVTVDGRRQSQVGGDTTLSTPGFDSASDRYDIDVSGGASSVTVDTSS